MTDEEIENMINVRRLSLETRICMSTCESFYKKNDCDYKKTKQAIGIDHLKDKCLCLDEDCKTVDDKLNCYINYMKEGLCPYLFNIGSEDEKK
jgi:phage-related protein